MRHACPLAQIRQYKGIFAAAPCITGIFASRCIGNSIDGRCRERLAFIGANQLLDVRDGIVPQLVRRILLLSAENDLHDCTPFFRAASFLARAIIRRTAIK